MYDSRSWWTTVLCEISKIISQVGEQEKGTGKQIEDKDRNTHDNAKGQDDKAIINLQQSQDKEECFVE